MASVNILCPNGRRQAIKVTPNTTVLQILEDVCLKRGFDAAKHDLKHGRTVLDISLTFRFSGIPNNGKLEMVVRDKARSTVTEVTIALQLENGERRQKTINSDSTLADMVREFAQKDEDLLHLSSNTDLHPVIINMREEIIGLVSLENTTLKSIGLLSGRVALRLVYRNVDSETLEQISQNIAKEKARREKWSTSSTTAPPSKPQQSQEPPRYEPHREVQQRLQPERAVTSPAQQMDTVESPVVTDITSRHIQQPPAKPAEAMETSSASENMVTADDKTSSSLDEPQNPTTAAGARSQVPTAAAERSVQSYSTQQIARNRASQNSQPSPSFVPQPMFTDFKFPEETAGKALYKNEMSDVKAEEYLPCDRELTVFSMLETRDIPQSAQYEEPGDDFFEVTKDDIQTMIKDLREQAKENENEPLMTSSMRQAKMEASFSKYEYAVIRFNMPDKMVLQARFRPRETVHSLTKFVQSHLRDKSQTFNLYTTPPKKVLNDAANTLIQACLVPMAIVYVGMDQPSFNEESCLCDETVALKQTKMDADSSAKLSLPAPRHSAQKKRAIPGAASTSSGYSSSRSKSNIASGASGGASTSQSKTGAVPKWYKPAGK